MIVRRLEPADVDAFRTVRLEGLRNHPENFGSDADDEASYPLERWTKWIERGGGFGAFVDVELVGIISFSAETQKKHRHQGSIGSFYVRPAWRGRGVADALMTAAIEEAARQVEHVSLTVTASNEGAIRLYKRHGFEVVGRIPASIRVDGADHDELSMHRRVAASD
ncbi:MAG: GNAT family N-acetyltransferase [Proteobacteria bacterium]|nr:GNAT family N-acetyltransferase [Pseudomonadota bacterium]